MRAALVERGEVRRRGLVEVAEVDQRAARAAAAPRRRRGPGARSRPAPPRRPRARRPAAARRGRAGRGRPAPAPAAAPPTAASRGRRPSACSRVEPAQQRLGQQPDAVLGQLAGLDAPRRGCRRPPRRCGPARGRSWPARCGRRGRSSARRGWSRAGMTSPAARVASAKRPCEAETSARVRVAWRTIDPSGSSVDGALGLVLGAGQVAGVEVHLGADRGGLGELLLGLAALRRRARRPGRAARGPRRCRASRTRRCRRDGPPGRRSPAARRRSTSAPSRISTRLAGPHGGVERGEDAVGERSSRWRGSPGRRTHRGRRGAWPAGRAATRRRRRRSSRARARPGRPSGAARPRRPGASLGSGQGTCRPPDRREHVEPAVGGRPRAGCAAPGRRRARPPRGSAARAPRRARRGRPGSRAGRSAAAPWRWSSSSRSYAESTAWSRLTVDIALLSPTSATARRPAR